MKAERRRAKTLKRLARFRRVERMQALDALSDAHHEQHKLQLLDERSRTMLEEAKVATVAQPGSDFITALKFRTQISGLANSTRDLHEQAEKRAKQAHSRLRDADKKLEKIEERAAEANAAASRLPQDGTAIAKGKRKTNQRSVASRNNA